MTLDALNRASGAQFLELIGGPLEGQTWLAERIAAGRPFASVDALYAAFEQAVNAASETEQIALIASHPDLAGKAAMEGAVSADSIREQAAAGLDRLTPQQYAEFHRLNTAYREKFGFPFVICARDNTRESILASFDHRLGSSRAQEIATALNEVLKILRLRLIDNYS